MMCKLYNDDALVAILNFDQVPAGGDFVIVGNCTYEVSQREWYMRDQRLYFCRLNVVEIAGRRWTDDKPAPGTLPVDPGESL